MTTTPQPVQPLPDFRTPKEKQLYYRDNADSYTATARVDGFAQTSRHATIGEAREAARTRAKTWRKPCLIYAVIGLTSEWLENVDVPPQQTGEG
jgi:hypothetical protein